ncbi:sel1 repeat family protein [Helicobacter pylori]|nr:sel1 repeat family protein [Helicobacter pylori]
MLENFKKAICRVLCLGLLGGGLMAEPNPEELFNLGMLSYDKQDFSKARKYFEKACGLNNSGGCGSLGMLYEYGQGVEKNLTKADQYFSKACKLGDQEACEILKELK